MDNTQDINKVELVGTLPRDPMFKQVGQNGTPLLSFTVMTSRKWIDPNTTEPKSSTQYNNVTAWRGLADTFAPQLKMGSRVKIVGELTSRSWDNPTTGQKQYKTEVVASQIQLISDGGASEATSSPTSSTSNSSSTTISPDDLPF